MLQNFLRAEGFETDIAPDGEIACRIFFQKEYALILLDLMIPKVSGMEVMRRIRERSMVPIIIISAKDTDSDKTLGLSLGADDYITKPFSVSEVLARIKANIRRSTEYAKKAEEKERIITMGSLCMSTGAHSVTKNGERIELTAKEFEILRLLMENPRKVYTKEQIYSLIWKDTYLGDEMP